MQATAAHPNPAQLDPLKGTSAPYVINARFLAHRVTGVQRYAREISSRLSPAPAFLAPSRGKGPRGHLWEQAALPREAAGRVLWSPCGAGPWRYGPQVVTFHDLFAIEHPEWYSPAYARWYGFLSRRLARRAVHLLAVSNYTRDRVAQLLGRDPHEITVAPNAASDSFRPVSAERAASAAAALALPSRRYILSVSSLEARKNLRGILEAWRAVQSFVPDDVWLVLAGRPADPSVFGKQTLDPIPPRVHFTGYVPDEQLPGLYGGAFLFLFPSLAEGFGLPLLEAMSCGLRAITSNTTSLPEVGGKAAVYVDPSDPRALAAAILAHFPRESAALAPFAPSLEQARRFSWDDSARKTEDVLLRAAASHARAQTAARRWRTA